MFYVKYNGRKLEIRDDNVYTRCGSCGREHKVDLEEILHDGGDLYGTSVFCPECSKQHRACMAPMEG